MSSIIDGLLENLGGDRLGDIASAIGGGSDQTSSALSSAIPAILGGMAQNTADPEGAQSLRRALDDHDGSVLDDPSELLGGGGPGNGILGHVLGDRRPAVEQAVSERSGLDLSAVGKLLPMLAPLVMGALGKQQRQDNLDGVGVADVVQREAKEAETNDAGLGSILGAVTGAMGGGGGGSTKSGLMGTIMGMVNKFLKRK